MRNTDNGPHRNMLKNRQSKHHTRLRAISLASANCIMATSQGPALIAFPKLIEKKGSIDQLSQHCFSACFQTALCINKPDLTPKASNAWDQRK